METYKYAIIGHGNWGLKVRNCLLKMGRDVAFLKKTRINVNEEIKNFQERMEDKFSKTSANVIWLCTPPSDIRDVLIIAAIKNNKKIIVEKPWVTNKIRSHHITKLCKENKINIFLTLQYLFIKKFSQVNLNRFNKKKYYFEGTFNTKKENPRIDAKLNLGFHLISIHQNFFKNTKIRKINTSYNSINQRSIKIYSKNELIFECDFTKNKEPILERYILHFEDESKKLILNIEFYSRIYKLINQLHAKESSMVKLL
ncbi:hypothetical protein FIT70_04310 [Candidatus Methylopumilus universalis]|uniref:Gfo/Idh/MocA family oxidoreductase n=1 Tax=Candidatus Methylopumilus universalis TaxID=2588536 RepID=UPI00111D6665|nr:Gfo/Idh/MocA family oxidoreductase [Candidatus Methylopumilus universalis]QDC99135.1 hypothetical protein FIT70_04310 [Candidatus Methylopumilus universalis]